MPADRQKMMKGNDGNILDFKIFLEKVHCIQMPNDILNYTYNEIKR